MLSFYMLILRAHGRMIVRRSRFAEDCSDAIHLNRPDMRPVLRVFDLPEAELPLIALQRFAAEDEGRTELPSERRKREEREKGNVPRSQDLASAAVLIGTVVALFFGGTLIYRQITDVFVGFLGTDYSQLTRLEMADVRNLAMDMAWRTAKIVAPIMIIAMIMAIVGNVLQFGLLFSAQALEFKPERLIPDFKRVLPVRRNFFNLGKILLQVIIIGTAAYLVIVDDYLPMLRTADMELNKAVLLFAWVAFKLLVVTAIILILLSVPDYFYQRYEYMENLKVTVSESRRERKDEEGDPMIRQRQRERGYELRRQRNMLQDVPRADVVVTNPTHYAVALQYDAGRAQAPIVLAKGADHLAFSIRTIARENRVPIEENPL
ncbi:MAG: EscU/YscU/HrcU family type III secretion system export apparatus switch protein, partial [Leptospiraceae bacterium]|nr:EscU/YscU/HrcU family type III secretion system export apparatus switch protein [Leptospiraceae bacterium]